MKKLLGGWLFLFALSVHAADSSSIKVASSISTFVVELSANPTTGYQWSVVDYDKAIVELKNSQYTASKTKLIGSGGIMRFTFAVIKDKHLPQKTEILFNYARPWEREAGRLKRVTVCFTKKL